MRTAPAPSPTHVMQLHACAGVGPRLRGSGRLYGVMVAFPLLCSFSHDSRYLAIAGEQNALDVENVETGG